MTRIIFLLSLIGLLNVNAKGQVSFSPVDNNLQKINNVLVYSSATNSLKFPLKRLVTVSPKSNFVSIGNQTIQILTLKFDGFKKDTKEENFANQKELLDAYSKYELAYFNNDLGIEVINPNSQWVVTKSKGWFIWYFKVGTPQKQLVAKTEIQLFATTVIGNEILIINAPIMTGGDFSNAALIVNEFMETFTIAKH